MSMYRVLKFRFAGSYIIYGGHFRVELPVNCGMGGSKNVILILFSSPVVFTVQYVFLRVDWIRNCNYITDWNTLNYC